MSFLLQDLFAFAAVISSLLVITSKNPVISVVFLISVFVNSAIYLILLGVSFIGISYIIIYVGAIAILFLFILMMINIKLTDILEVGTDYTKNLPLALVLGALFIFAVYTIIPFSFQDISFFSKANALLGYLNSLLSDSGLDSLKDSSALYKETNYMIAEYPGTHNIGDIYTTAYPFDADAHLIDFTQIEALGQNLYTQSSLLFILTSLILLLSMLAPIILSSAYNTKK
jgi:NADH-ubiquinone oxidoreductase chain 6